MAGQRIRAGTWAIKGVGKVHADVYIDVLKMGRVVTRAAQSKGKKATALRGGVVVKITPVPPVAG